MREEKLVSGVGASLRVWRMDPEQPRREVFLVAACRMASRKADRILPRVSVVPASRRGCRLLSIGWRLVQELCPRRSLFHITFLYVEATRQG